MPVESLGWFLFGAGCASVWWGVVFLIPHIIAKHRDNKKFEDFIQDLKAQGEELIKQQGFTQETKQVSQLMFRDKTGTLCTAEIVIDPDLPEFPPMDQEAMFKIKSGDVGTINDMMQGKHKGSLDDVEKFIFSPLTVQRMREHGLEPDEFVRNMLKASGRIA